MAGPETQRIEELRRRWEAEPSSRVYLQLADEYLKLGDLSRAAEVLRKGLEQRPGDLSGQVALGRCLVELGDSAEAVERLEAVLEKDPAHIVGNKLLIRAYLGAGRPELARERLEIHRLLDDRDVELEELELALERVSAGAGPSHALDAEPEAPAGGALDTWSPEAAETAEGDAGEIESALSAPVGGTSDDSLESRLEITRPEFTPADLAGNSAEGAGSPADRDSQRTVREAEETVRASRPEAASSSSDREETQAAQGNGGGTAVSLEKPRIEGPAGAARGRDAGGGPTPDPQRPFELPRLQGAEPLQVASVRRPGRGEPFSLRPVAWSAPGDDFFGLVRIAAGVESRAAADLAEEQPERFVGRARDEGAESSEVFEAPLAEPEERVAAAPPETARGAEPSTAAVEEPLVGGDVEDAPAPGSREESARPAALSGDFQAAAAQPPLEESGHEPVDPAGEPVEADAPDRELVAEDRAPGDDLPELPWDAEPPPGEEPDEEEGELEPAGFEDPTVGVPESVAERFRTEDEARPDPQPEPEREPEVEAEVEPEPEQGDSSAQPPADRADREDEDADVRADDGGRERSSSPEAKAETATLGELYLKQGHLDEAEAIFHRLLAKNPESVRARWGLRRVRAARPAPVAAALLLARSAGQDPPEGLTAKKIQVLGSYIDHLRRGDDHVH